jgi:hypothetical protein
MLVRSRLRALRQRRGIAAAAFLSSARGRYETVMSDGPRHLDPAPLLIVFSTPPVTVTGN